MGEPIVMGKLNFDTDCRLNLTVKSGSGKYQVASGKWQLQDHLELIILVPDKVQRARGKWQVASGKRSVAHECEAADSCQRDSPVLRPHVLVSFDGRDSLGGEEGVGDSVNLL